jgi:hypothetical protein
VMMFQPPSTAQSHSTPSHATSCVANRESIMMAYMHLTSSCKDHLTSPLQGPLRLLQAASSPSLVIKASWQTHQWHPYKSALQMRT